MHWLVHFLGFDDLSGPWYGFWSGFGSDLGEVAIVGALYGMFRKHNCHEKGCWRIGKHVVDGTPWCSRHHQAARAALAADGPVRAGAGTNPASEVGLPAETATAGPVVPPAAASNSTKGM